MMPHRYIIMPDALSGAGINSRPHYHSKTLNKICFSSICVLGISQNLSKSWMSSPTYHRIHPVAPVSTRPHFVESLLSFVWHPSQDSNLDYTVLETGLQPSYSRDILTAFNEPLFCPLTLCGGVNLVRTDDLLLARQALSQLSYDPMVQTTGFEPVTPRLSVECSTS